MAAMVADVEDSDAETDVPRFLKSVHEKAEYICQENVERRIVHSNFQGVVLTPKMELKF